MQRASYMVAARAMAVARPTLRLPAGALLPAASRLLPAAAVRLLSTNASATPNVAPTIQMEDNDTHNDFKPVYKQTQSTSAEDARRQIENDIKTHDVFVYMKGSPSAPKCGFSANVCRILNAYPGVKYASRDVLEDENIRQQIKAFSDWPTLPQLFVKGEFVGGSDIISNMYKTGELDKLLGHERPTGSQ